MCNIIISHARAAMLISICHVPVCKYREERNATYLSYSRALPQLFEEGKRRFMVTFIAAVNVIRSPHNCRIKVSDSNLTQIIKLVSN